MKVRLQMQPPLQNLQARGRFSQRAGDVDAVPYLRPPALEHFAPRHPAQEGDSHHDAPGRSHGIAADKRHPVFPGDLGQPCPQGQGAGGVPVWGPPQGKQSVKGLPPWRRCRSSSPPGLYAPTGAEKNRKDRSGPPQSGCPRSQEMVPARPGPGPRSHPRCPE